MSECQRNSPGATELLHEADQLLGRRMVGEALFLYEQAQKTGADPDGCSGGQWMCHMLLGDFASAWRASDQIAERGSPDPLRFWDGKSLSGKRVIVRCLHGLGDTLQFARFLPQIRQSSSELTLEVQPALRSLFEESMQWIALGVDHLITWGEPEPAWDVQIEINEVARILRVNQLDVMMGNAYITVGGVGPIYDDLADPARIGLVWTASSFNPARSVAPELLAPLLAKQNVHFYNLQGWKDDGSGRDLGAQVVNVCGPDTTVLHLAQSMRTMDLVITVDTMAAHLAGAMGLKVWTLLPFIADWRWMLQRVDSPWYPSMRLFRQSCPTGWHDVLQTVSQELQSFILLRGETARLLAG